MALVNIASFSIRDGSDKVKSMPYYFPQAATVAQMQAWITAHAPLLDAVIDGKIESVSLTLAATLPGGLKASPVEAGNRVREGALLSLAAANTNYKEDLYVPSWKESMFVDDELSADAAVGDFTASIIASGAGTEATDRYGNDITAVAKSGRTFRK